MGLVVINGQKIEYSIAILSFNEELVDEMFVEDKLCSEQQFVNSYVKRHKLKFNEIFDVETQLRKIAKETTTVTTDEFMLNLLDMVIPGISLGDILIPPAVLRKIAAMMTSKWERTHEPITNEEAIAYCKLVIMRCLAELNKRLLAEEKTND